MDGEEHISDGDGQAHPATVVRIRGEARGSEQGVGDEKPLVCAAKWG